MNGSRCQAREQAYRRLSCLRPLQRTQTVRGPKKSTPVYVKAGRYGISRWTGNDAMSEGMGFDDLRLHGQQLLMTDLMIYV